VVEEARRDDTGDVPPRSMIRGLAKLVPGLNCAFGELEPTRRYVILQDTDEDYYGVGVDTDAALGIEPDPTWRLMRQHPNCRYLRTTGRTEVVQFSDFVTARQFHALEIYQRVFRLAGIEHMISVPLPAPPGRSRSISIVRERGSGFSETERAMLALLPPHLYQIFKQAAARRRAPVRLTLRQLDVLRCVALGMSNDKIANHLVIAPGTVTKHLENIYIRLGVTSRTAAVARMFGDD